MPRFDFFRAAGLALAIGLSGCGARAEAPEVVVTLKPVHALVAGVMEGVGEPGLLIDGMASPHTYQLRPSDAGALAGAALIVWVGPSLEAGLPDMLSALNPDALVIELTAAEGLHLLPARAPGLAAQDAGHDGHDHGPVDPHLWLEVANAIAITAQVAEALSTLDPDNAAAYRRNGAAQIARLQMLDDEIRQDLAPFAEAPFLTFHDGLHYFEAAYGLNGLGTIMLGPDRMPGARTVMDIRRQIEDRQIACVFTEPQLNPALLAILLEGTPARQGELDPLGAEIPAGTGGYETMMRGLADNLINCLGGAGLAE